MRSRKSNTLTELITIILSFALSFILLSLDFLSVDVKFTSPNAAWDTVFQSDSMQRQFIAKTETVKDLDNFNVEEIVQYQNVFTTVFTQSLRVSRSIFSNLVFYHFSNPLIRSFLSNETHNCPCNIVMILYIHDIDGKI